MKIYANRIKQLRNSRKMSQEEFATKIGVSRSTVGMYETGKREPDLETCEAIADFFNVDMDYLLGKSQVANQALSLIEKSTPQTKRDVLKQRVIELLEQLTDEELKEAARYLDYLLSSQDKQ